MRGRKTFDSIIGDNSLKVAHKKGRNHLLIATRNECLLARYYYYGSTKNKCYEEVLRQLSVEFFLSPGTISAIIQDHTDELLNLKKRGPGNNYFQMRWPHLKW